MSVLLVAIGGALGSVARYALGGFVGAMVQEGLVTLERAEVRMCRAPDKP
jgi:fluoride ion exporter CrcB/FEX